MGLFTAVFPVSWVCGLYVHPASKAVVSPSSKCNVMCKLAKASNVENWSIQLVCLADTLSRLILLICLAGSIHIKRYNMQSAHVTKGTWCKVHMLQSAHAANCTCCKVHMLQSKCVAKCTCCKVHVLQSARNKVTSNPYYILHFLSYTLHTLHIASYTFHKSHKP